MTCIVQFETKKAMKEAIAEGKDFMIDDPSIFAPKQFMVSELPEGQMITVTNHPKRSWFASIEKRGALLIVK